ncbi:MAG: hypothetical protein HYV78_01200 [Candidatus Wildermuthbacteria bacterium]|nr:hypothetical protein [Candidatus Wildermuthbacteria bacterium]
MDGKKEICEANLQITPWWKNKNLPFGQNLDRLIPERAALAGSERAKKPKVS